MTLRRLRWLLLPTLAAAVLATLILPPRTLPARITFVGTFFGFSAGPWRPDVQDQHRSAIESARDRLTELIAARAHGAADVLASRSPRALRSRVEPVVLVRDAEVPELAARAWLQAAEREIGQAPRAGTRGVPVIVALHTKSPVGFRGTVLSGTLRDRFQFEEGTTRACIVDIVFPVRAERGSDRFEVPRGLGSGLLGRCALYARFGFPGRGTQAWAGLGPRWTGRWWWYGGESLFLPLRLPPDTLHFRGQYGGVPWAELGCFRGMDTYCASLAGLTTVTGVERGSGFYYYYGWGYQPTADRLVTDLILHRGPDRFARFWSSALPPDSALQAAYGVPAGSLAREAFSRRFVPEPLAQPGLAGLVVAAGWAIALGVLAMGLAWRREMDL